MEKNKKGLMDKAGDLIEKVGHKVSEAGAPGLGQKIHDAGDLLERSHKNPSHPHSVDESATDQTQQSNVRRDDKF